MLLPIGAPHEIFPKNNRKTPGIRQCSENSMSSCYDERNFIIENPDNIVRIHVYSAHYAQSAMFTTAVNVINIRHEFGLHIRFPARLISSKSSSSIWSIIRHGLGILKFILVTCRNQLDLYLLSFSSGSATFTIYSFRLWSKTGMLGFESVYADLLLCVCVDGELY